ncbi:lysophospholipase [Luminiphilus sp.]|jgi:alpha-beta hydrolase superfamily lysophospholipase|nr:alpha/beta hydrolase [Luminiphilus sp.]MDA9681903.1 lysophospholipase [Luminiphilus sp.]
MMETLSSGIQYRHWPAQEAKACILLIHGLAEHTGRYERLAAYFNARNIAVVGPDHIGHGASPGTRAYVAQFSEYLAPLTELRAAIRGWYSDTPTFMLGHSMGGLIAAHLLLQDAQSYRGAMLSAPAFAADEAVSPVTLWLGRLLRAVMPKIGMMSLEANQISRDPAVVADYIADPLVYNGKITAALGMELLSAMDDAIAGAQHITLPIYMAHGEADVMAMPDGSRAFFQALASQDKTLDWWPDLYHEIFNEPESEAVMDRFAGWLEAHL